MKRFIGILTLVLMAATSCTHKELCFNHREHAHKYHVNIIADYRYDWEECYGGPNWQESWPEYYIDYESLRPKQPKGLRVEVYNDLGDSNAHNISANGGVITLYEGYNDLLLCNNDTEYIVFSRTGNGATISATTRTSTRAPSISNRYAEEGEPSVEAPDMLYANYYEGYLSEKTLDPTELYITLQPLVYTYKIRYEFAKGLKYVARANGALSGMARSVDPKTGDTSDETATIRFDCTVTDFGARALVNSFGVPGYPHANYPITRGSKHGLNIEITLRNGNTIVREFDVTDQVNLQPHGGVIVVDNIVIEDEEGMQGSGSFDVTVDEWGGYENIPLPLM